MTNHGRLPLAAKLLLLMGIALCLSVPAVRADNILFQDSLQSNLNQWVPAPGNTGSAVITSDPLGDGNALTFGKGARGGDIESLGSFTSSTGLFTLSFQFLATCGQPSGCGAFVLAGPPTAAFNNGWILSDTSYTDGIYGPLGQIPDTGQWETVTYTFKSTSPIILALEMWASAPNEAPDSVWFKDIVLTDDSSGVAPGTLRVPEPGTLSLLGMGFLGLGFIRRRKLA